MTQLHRLLAALIAAPLLLPATHTSFSMAQTTSQTAPQRTIAITGTSEVTAPPDMATVMVGVVEQAETAGQALSANNAKMNALIQTLKDAGIADRDIQTSNFSINPRYEFDQQRQTQKMIGYEVSNQVAIRVRKLADLGALLDRVVQAGSNQVNGIGFAIDDTAKLEDEARRRAFANARHKAEVYTAAAGATLGPVSSIAETMGYRPPVPVLARARMAADAAPAVPVAAGEASITATVDVVWELK